MTPGGTPAAEVPIRPAATLLPIREAQGTLEVCLLRRNADSTWVGGLALFPGGAVDPRDHAPELLRHANLGTGRLAESLPGTPAPWIAAVRETFEEIGVLLATDADGRWAWQDPHRQARLSSARAAIASEQADLAPLLETEALTLRIDQLHFLAHWVTPPRQARRYDTRFYLAAVPGDAPVQADGTEIVDAEWLTPAAAIGDHESGTLPMLPPTLAALHWLAQYATVQQAVDGVQALGEIPRLEPSDLPAAARATFLRGAPSSTDAP